MDKIVDHLFVLDGDSGNIKDFPGNYTDYRQKQLQDKKQSYQEESTKTVTEEKQQQKASYEQRKAYNRVMKEIEKLEAKKKAIEEQFLDASLPLDKITELSQQLNDLKDKLEEKEMEWLELAEIVEG